METQIKKSSLAMLALGAIGVVYGDIGTSPLYTMQVIFGASTGVPLNMENIFGAVSSIFWLLTLVVTLKYVLLVLRADNKGEGGVMALLSLALSSISTQDKRYRMILLLGVFGAALFYGDSVLTPAISVLSAVEGLEIVSPQLASYVLPSTIGILIALYSLQKFGTSLVGRFFGPIVVVWFLVLAAVGLWQIKQYPQILHAINPIYALHFLESRGYAVFIAVGAILLAVTGAEALYADMGHFGRPAIKLAWLFLVFPCLVINYFGQGALLLVNPQAVSNPFYLSFPQFLLIPAVVLATLATIIASQAVISGAFSITQQSIQLGFLPRMRIVHTSASERGQIYMPAINWTLLCVVIVVCIGFGSSSALATAYGIAVTGTMLITTILSFFVVYYRWKYPLWAAIASTCLFGLLDALLLSSASMKFMQGGWFPVTLSLAVLLLMITWRKGRETLFKNIMQNDPKLLEFINHLSRDSMAKSDRTAIFMVSNPETVPLALLHNLKHNHVLHSRNLIVTVVFRDVPYLSQAERLNISKIGSGFWQIQLNYGFMETPDVPLALDGMVLDGKLIEPFSNSYFLSRDIIISDGRYKIAKWRSCLFAYLSRNASSAIDYFNIPPSSVIELGSRVQI